jgi:hypothetical protein
MPKHEYITVDLPNLKPKVELSPTLADLLRLTLASGAAGISSPGLLEAGFISAHNTVSELRKYAAIIHSERRSVPVWRGRYRHEIAHYFNKGWIDQQIADRDMEV